MGLKTTNFEVAKMKETLPEAYAIIRSLRVEPNGQGVAIIGVHRTRELAIDPNVVPFHEETVHFQSDRNGNPYELAYKAASVAVMNKRFNHTTREIVEVENRPFFHGWENDIITEE